MAADFLPYGRQQVSEEDIAAVVEVLRSDWLTTGPKGREFEQALSAYVACAEAVAVANGTAALHAACAAAGIGPGDEVIVPAITFAATANAVVYLGATPVFADVDPATLLVDIASVESKMTHQTKAVIAVDYAGQPCDYDALRQLAQQHNLVLIADASHSLGAAYKGRRCGSLADLTTFSFHPVKPLTTAEGGAVCTTNPDYAERMRRFRNHGISMEHQQRSDWRYEMTDLGFNYRLSDLQSALGISQLKKIDEQIARRQHLAAAYRRHLADSEAIRPLSTLSAVDHGYHLFVVKVPASQREEIFHALSRQGIGVNVHYLPVYLHPFYRDRFNYGAGLCPVAEQVYEEIISLPIFPAMTEEDVARVVTALQRCCGE
ncbi:MAG: UDP-4-amino-4,6-dideoxy-N-acetyl-beta-L-altrosamine transaminase [Pelovirga sp.]